jgi:pimeloyl-ACP methyl ester carboxylesterase
MFQNRSHLESIMRKTWMMALGATAALLMTGCGESADNFSAEEAVGGYTLFSIDTGEIPYPNDILLDSNSGKIHFDTDPADADYAVKSALNTLDGFSTTSPITVTISGEINASTLQGHAQLIDTAAGAMGYGTDYAVAATNEKIAILPLHPLASDHRYIAVLTKGIRATNGKLFEPDYVTSLLLGTTPLIDAHGNPTVVLASDPDTNIQKAEKLEAIRQHTQSLIAAAGIPANQILDIWSFKTQTIGAVAKAFSDANTSATLQLTDSNHTSKDILLAAGYDVNDTMAGDAELYVGTLSNLPYYLGIPSGSDPTAPLHRSFVFDGNSTLPKAEANVTIPVLASVPKSSVCGSVPASGWPVVIFQHGITQNRTNLLAISEAFAHVCYAAVAIDLPLHGITDINSPLRRPDIKERTFDVDYVTQDDQCNVTAYQPDGKPDCSGTHYINLQSLLTSRDNVRQSTSDFIALKNALGSATGVTFDTSKIAYVGHSLGAMAPYAFLSHRKLSSVVLANPGGGIAQLLNNSPRFAPVIEAGLAAKGIMKGTAEYDAFMLAVQTIVDDADPINYAQSAAANQKMLTFETIGDQVIPNSMPTAPLAGTDPLLRMMGANDINLSDANATGFITLLPQTNTVTRFESGTHSSILDPGNTPEVTIEMQTEAASFVKSGGAGVQTTPYASSIIKQ